MGLGGFGGLGNIGGSGLGYGLGGGLPGVGGMYTGYGYPYGPGFYPPVLGGISSYFPYYRGNFSAAGVLGGEFGATGRGTALPSYRSGYRGFSPSYGVPSPVGNDIHYYGGDPTNPRNYFHADGSPYYASQPYAIDRGRTAISSQNTAPEKVVATVSSASVANYAKAHRRLNELKAKNPTIYASVHDLGLDWQRKYASWIVKQGDFLTSYYYGHPYFRHHYMAWEVYGFPGYTYPIQPAADVGQYFNYPLLSWLYLDGSATESEYYKAYDGEVVSAFSHPRVFYPTITVRDLAVDASALDAKLQANFRTAVTKFLSNLKGAVTAASGESFRWGSDGEVVLTRYENLQNEIFIIEGFVAYSNKPLAFRGIFNLVDPDDSSVLLPTSEMPAQNDVDALNRLNGIIRNVGHLTAKKTKTTLPIVKKVKGKPVSK